MSLDSYRSATPDVASGLLSTSAENSLCSKAQKPTKLVVFFGKALEIDLNAMVAVLGKCRLLILKACHTNDFQEKGFEIQVKSLV